MKRKVLSIKLNFFAEQRKLVVLERKGNKQKN